MLLLVYRSITTMLMMLVTVAVELAAARGVVAALAHSGSDRAVDLLDQPADAAGDRGRHRLRDTSSSADITRPAGPA